jgi:hypothetical protein
MTYSTASATTHHGQPVTCHVTSSDDRPSWRVFDRMDVENGFNSVAVLQILA